MKHKKPILLLSSFVVFPFTLILFKATTHWFGLKNGFLLGLVAYWSYTLVIAWTVLKTEKGYLKTFMNYQGGFIALVGGAYIMGMLWCFISRKVQNIKYCIMAHVFVNFFAFTGLFVQNNIGA